MICQEIVSIFKHLQMVKSALLIGWPYFTPSYWPCFEILFPENYDVYVWVHETDKAIGFNGNSESSAKDLADLMEILLPAYLDETKALFVAHSRGGLVCRSYMNNDFNYDGIDGGENILGLITLGTPHHGSPGAVPDWVAMLFEYDSNSETNPALWAGLVMNGTIGTSNLGYLTLAWDNMDLAVENSQTFSMFWVETFYLEISKNDMNVVYDDSISDLTEFYTENMKNLYGTLFTLNEQEKYKDKIVAFAAYDNLISDVVDVGNIVNSIWDGHEALEVATRLLFDYDYIVESPVNYYANDGMVPIQSALFLDISNSTSFASIEHDSSMDLYYVDVNESEVESKINGLKKVLYSGRDFSSDIKDHLDLLDTPISDDYWDILKGEIIDFKASIDLDNHPPVLSNPHVDPSNGTVSTQFKFTVDYYDPDGDAPDPNFSIVQIIGPQTYTMNMSLESGSPSDGTYSCTTTLPLGEYYFYFTFADINGATAVSSTGIGPSVYSDTETAINIVIQCTRFSSDFWIQYSLSSEDGPWNDVPINSAILDPITAPRGSHVWFRVGSSSPNFTYREWALYHSGTNLGNNYLSNFDFVLDFTWDEVGLDIFYKYTPQKYTISGMVEKSDGTLVPGGVDFELKSEEQHINIHTDNGTWFFSDVIGGVTVTITPSAEGGYTFSPAVNVFCYLDGDHEWNPVIAYYSDDYVPITTLEEFPNKVNFSSDVVFSWYGTDNQSSPESILFQYLLEGYDTEWSEWTTNTSMAYQLENGSYTFKVRAKDEAGNINQSPTTYDFVVNAAPLVISSARNNRSIWCTRITLEMPLDANGPSAKFVLLPSHSGLQDENLVPVSIHQVEEENPVGVNEIIADYLNMTTCITSVKSGWLITLPQDVLPGKSVSYDILWGEKVYFGWQEFVSIPQNFPNSHELEGFYNSFGIKSSYLDKNMRLWRLAMKNHLYGGNIGESKAWVFLNIVDENGSYLDEYILDHTYGHPFDGEDGYRIWFVNGRLINNADQNLLIWERNKNGWTGSDNYNYSALIHNLLNIDGSLISTYEGSFDENIDYAADNLIMIDDNIWIIGDTTSNPNELWYMVTDKYGNEKIQMTTIDTANNSNGFFTNQRIMQLGDYALLFWAEGWMNDNDRSRIRIKYQVRDLNGNLVKETTILTPVIDDSIDKHDDYDGYALLTDKEGKVWCSIGHGQTDMQYEYYYAVIGNDGEIWKDLTLSSERTFKYCDRDGKIWVTQNGEFLALNPDDTIAAEPRSITYTPTQDVEYQAAEVTNDGYRLFDRWTPRLIDLNILGETDVSLMKIYDLDLWDNDLHPSNLEVKKDNVLVWNSTGQFTGTDEVDLSSVDIVNGHNVFSLSQDDFLGGQILISFPYNPDSDNDGTPDCNDGCPDDPNKVEPGFCGCGVADSDTDNDGIPDCYNDDSDNDGLPDAWEYQHFGDLSTADDGTDTDSDNLLDIDEYTYGTDPNDKYTDDDDYSDGDEVLYHSDPTLTTDTPDNHKPDKPIIQPETTDVPLRYHVFSVNEYSDPDSDDLASSEWQISTDEDFSEDGIVFQKSLVIGTGIIGEEEDALLLTMSEPVFLPDTYYWIRVMLEDSTGLWSSWADTVAFTTVSIDPDDLDNNGVDDSYQVNEPTDTNNNGVDDTDEGIKAIYDAEQGEIVGVDAGEGSISGLTSLSTSDIPEEFLPDDSMPYGLFSFRIDGLSAGETVNVTFYFSDDIPSDAKWYKYDSAGGTLVGYTDNIVINGNAIILSITDGGSGDFDETINSIIIDPSGPVFIQEEDTEGDVDDNDGNGSSEADDNDDDDGDDSGGGCFIENLVNGSGREVYIVMVFIAVLVFMTSVIGSAFIRRTTKHTKKVL